MANKLLGEVEIELCGEKYILKPEFEGLVEMEDRSGSSIAVLINKMIAGSLGIRDITAIIYGGMVGFKTKQRLNLTFLEVGNMVIAEGMTKLLTACGKLLAAGYSGKPIDDGDTEIIDKKKDIKGR